MQRQALRAAGLAAGVLLVSSIWPTRAENGRTGQTNNGLKASNVPTTPRTPIGSSIPSRSPAVEQAIR